MKHFFKAIKRTCLSIAVTALIIAGLVYFLLFSTPGLIISLSVAKLFLPGSLSFSSLKGQAFHHILAEEITYKSPSIEITLKQVDLTWDFASLLHQQLIVKDLTISEARLYRKVISHINLKGEINRDNWQIHRLDFMSEDNQIALTGSGKRNASNPLSGILTLKSAKPNEKSLQGNIQFHGDANKLLWTGNLTNPKPLHLEGSLTNYNIFRGLITALDPTLPFKQIDIEGKRSGLKIDTIIKTLFSDKINADLKKQDLALTPIKLSIETQSKTWLLSSNVLFHNHPVQVKGKGNLMKGVLTFEGRDLPLLNTSEYLIQASPSLSLDISPSHVTLKGSIIIPKANIAPRGFTETSSLTDDVVFVDTPPPVANPLNLEADVDIIMGNEVALKVKGLEGFLQGNIHLKQMPNSALTALGELSIKDGKYHTFGQELTIEQGQLIFTGGPVENPNVALKAVRIIKNTVDSLSQSNSIQQLTASTPNLGHTTTVGIEVTGRLKKPNISLFSIPTTISQSDILSLLILGKPASLASQSGGQLLLTAVSALNLSQGTNKTQLLQQLKQTLGVDFDITKRTQYDQKTKQLTENTAFVISKSLSKRLSLSYNVGLAQTDSNILTLRYLLNHLFSIQIDTSNTASGIDLLYTHTKE